jgi:predicted nucleic acid-binding protein
MHGFGTRLGFPRRIARAYGATRTLRLPPLRLRGMRTGSRILLLQTLAEFSSVAIRKAGIAVDEVRTTIDAWRAVLPVQGTEDDDLSAALDAVKKHRLAFWDAMLWAAAQRAGVRHLLYRGPAGRF